jgi:hypothetical protein
MGEFLKTLSDLTNLERVLLSAIPMLVAVIIALFRRLEKATEARLMDRQILEEMSRVLLGVDRMVALTFELLKERVR